MVDEMVSRRGFVAGLAAVPLAGCSDELIRYAPKADGPESKGPVRGENEVTLEVREGRGSEGPKVVENGQMRPLSGQSRLDSDPLWAAGRAAFTYVAEELGFDEHNTSLEYAIGSVPQQQSSAPIVMTSTWINRNGVIEGEVTDPEFERLVAATPSTVLVNYLPESRSPVSVSVFAAHHVRYRY